MRDLGKQGEALAVQLCRKRGLSVLETNFRTPCGEIDIIAREGAIIVFIEVKTRSSRAFGSPLEAVTARKRTKIRNAALCYLRKFSSEVPVRFDVISITVEGGVPAPEYIQDAFES